MGRSVRDCLSEFPDIDLRACVAPSAGEKRAATGDRHVPWLTPEALADPAARASLPDDLVVLDVSAGEGPSRLAKILTEWPRALVAAATGLDRETEARLERLSEKVAVLRAPNLSLGIAVIEGFLRSLPEAARAVFEADIVEQHHAGKRDAPSGTALALAMAIGTSGAGSRPGGEVRIASIRAGTAPGMHRIVLSGAGETVEIVHTAYDRSVFARGALRAAQFLHGRPAGLYSMAHIVAQT
jgi:4-hydroxy-tetrahydrodipicolinate reductase